MGKLLTVIVGAVALFAIIALLALFFGAIVALLWNATLVSVFPAIPAIGYWQGAGLYLLCRTLFSSSASS